MLVEGVDEEFHFAAFCFFENESFVLRFEKCHFGFAPADVAPDLGFHDAFDEVLLVSHVVFTQSFEFLWEVHDDLVVDIVTFEN